MPRGEKSPVGTVIINKNGYSQTKTEEGWKGTHIIILEEKLGRKLLAGERAKFVDGDKSNLHPDNIVLADPSNARSIHAKIAKLQAEVDDRLQRIKDLKSQLSPEKV